MNPKTRNEKRSADRDLLMPKRLRVLTIRRFNKVYTQVLVEGRCTMPIHRAFRDWHNEYIETFHIGD